VPTRFVIKAHVLSVHERTRVVRAWKDEHDITQYERESIGWCITLMLPGLSYDITLIVGHEKPDIESNSQMDLILCPHLTNSPPPQS
jgi:hypothetical protein